jgi:hypothetical protein
LHGTPAGQRIFVAQLFCAAHVNTQVPAASQTPGAGQTDGQRSLGSGASYPASSGEAPSAPPGPAGEPSGEVPASSPATVPMSTAPEPPQPSQIATEKRSPIDAIAGPARIPEG